MISFSFLDTNLFFRIFLNTYRIKVSNIISLENNTYKFKKNCNRRFLSKRDIIILNFDDIETTIISKKFKQNFYKIQSNFL